jgi:hypothetical protein
MAGTFREFKETAMRRHIRRSFAIAGMAAAMALAAFAATTPAQAEVRMGRGGFDGGGFQGDGGFRSGGFGHGYRGYAGGYEYGYGGYRGGYGGSAGYALHGGCASSLWMLNRAC